jgi:PDZ domain-containing protein
VKRLVSPGILLTVGLVLVAVVLGLFIYPSNEYIFLPDPAHPVAPLVTIANAHDPKQGGIYFVDVVVRKATLLEKLFGGLHEGADLYPASAINPPGTNDSQRRQIDLEDMANSQQVAGAVAEKAAGKKVVITETGAKIDEIEPGRPAVGKLEPDDVITAVDGKRVKSPAGVFSAMKKVPVGQTVAFTITRDHATKVERMRTVGETPKSKRAVVGVFLEPSIDIHLPIPVSIDAGGVGGPSAGLAFALEVLQKLGRNVTHGLKIAATGEIFPDGSVGPIGGIKQKTIGAKKTGVDAFLVPAAGDNAADARKYAHGLRIIPVKTFPQALRALATLR